MRTRKEVKEDLVKLVSATVGGAPEVVSKIIDLWFEMQDVPADDKVNANCYTCGNVVRVTKETRTELDRTCGVFVCESCYERGKAVTSKP